MQDDHAIDVTRELRAASAWLAEVGGRDADARLEDAWRDAQRRLRDERDRAQLYLDVAGTMIVVVGRDERVELINRKGLAVLGYAEEEIVGANWFDAVAPLADRGALRGSFRALVEGREQPAERYESIVVTHSGERRMVAWHTTLLIDEEGEIQGTVSSGEDITDRRRAEHQIAYLAYHDDLTGLPNRTLLREHLDLALARARRHGRAIALLYVDLDNFKLVNDSLGHHAGDQLLCRVAARLQRVTRATDLLARQGGDEFLLLLTDLDGDSAAIARTVAAHIEQALQTPFTLSGAEFQIGASIGISLHPRDAADADALLMHADAAMYKAKRGGEAKVRLYEAGGPDPLERLSLTTRLRRALERTEFVLHYQPIFRIEVGRPELVGVEALIRWEDPERGLISPGEFIPVAEDTGMIEPIGTWVVDEVCRQGRIWAREGLHPRLSFNVSPRQLRRAELAAELEHSMTVHGIPPHQLVVEITESATLRDAARTEPVLDRLHDLGVSLAIDDFGAGYSSLGRLSQMPVGTVKIDRSFLQSFPQEPQSVEVISAIMQLAQALGLGTVAEGVERQDQLRTLIDLGCTHAQGFHLGRPMPPEAITRLLLASQ